jgi:hypothetical protein
MMALLTFYVGVQKFKPNSNLKARNPPGELVKNKNLRRKVHETPFIIIVSYDRIRLSECILHPADLFVHRSHIHSIEVLYFLMKWFVINKKVDPTVQTIILRKKLFVFENM